MIVDRSETCKLTVLAMDRYVSLGLLAGAGQTDENETTKRERRAWLRPRLSPRLGARPHRSIREPRGADAWVRPGRVRLRPSHANATHPHHARTNPCGAAPPASHIGMWAQLFRWPACQWQTPSAGFASVAVGRNRPGLLFLCPVRTLPAPDSCGLCQRLPTRTRSTCTGAVTPSGPARQRRRPHVSRLRSTVHHQREARRRRQAVSDGSEHGVEGASRHMMITTTGHKFARSSHIIYCSFLQVFWFAFLHRNLFFLLVFFTVIDII